MSFKDKVIIYFYQFTKTNSLFHETVRCFYLWVLIPLLKLFLKVRFKSILQVISRNSVLRPKQFNAFLSDIDLTIVTNTESEINKIVAYFLQLKKILIMLDIPEIYLAEEYKQMTELMKSENYNFNKVIWNIRKINWNLDKLSKSNNKIEKIKLEKSIYKSFYFLTRKKEFTKELLFSDISYFKDSQEFKTKNSRCYMLPFLGTDLNNSMSLVMNEETFQLFDYLMPINPIGSTRRELKLEIMHFELLISKSSIRIDQALKIDTNKKSKWIKFLSIQIAN